MTEIHPSSFSSGSYIFIPLLLLLLVLLLIKVLLVGIQTSIVPILTNYFFVLSLFIITITLYLSPFMFPCYDLFILRTHHEGHNYLQSLYNALYIYT